MPVEPGLVDTNVLVYALDADSAQHASARALLEAGRAASLFYTIAIKLPDTPRRSEAPPR